VRSTTLSLESVTWTNRILAVALALLVAIILIGPVSLLVEAVESGEVRALRGAPEAFGFFSLLLLLSPPLLVAVAVCWGVPALLITHIALWQRCGLLTFILAGAAIGIVGFVILGVTVLPLQAVRPLWPVPAAMTGAIAAIAAWWFMWIGLKET